MSEPYWIALGSGGAVDYAGEWAAGTAYPAGSVVSKDGYTYIAVNPSVGQTPPSAFGPSGPGLVRIAEQILSSPAASIDFTSIPQTYRHLRVVAMLRGDQAVGQLALRARVNGDTGANYDSVQQQAWSTSVAGGEALAAAYWEFVNRLPGATAGAGRFAMLEFDYPWYAQAVAQKIMLGTLGAPVNTVAGANQILVGIFAMWRSTAPITALNFLPSANNFDAGSRAALYGVM
jgi:hypothetical protein